MSVNAVQSRIVKELTERERALCLELQQVEGRMMAATRSGEEARLEAEGDKLAKEITDIDEVLRLLETR